MLRTGLVIRAEVRQGLLPSPRYNYCYAYYNASLSNNLLTFPRQQSYTPGAFSNRTTETPSVDSDQSNLQHYLILELIIVAMR